MNDPETRKVVDRRAALEARDWLVRLTSGDVGEADMASFRAWRDALSENSRAFAREAAFWRQLEMLGGGRLEPHAVPTVARSVGRRAVLAGGGALALAGAAAVAAPRLGLSWTADLWTAPGEQREARLSDGSAVFLNTDTALALDFEAERRVVRLLKGEAMFQVRAGAAQMLRVSTLNGSADASDADFAVRTEPGLAMVTSARGEVRVAGVEPPNAGGAVLVQAGRRTQVPDGGTPTTPVSIDVETELAWRGGRVVFEGRPFADAVGELARYLPERVLLAPNVNGRAAVSAIFSLRAPHAAVAALAATQGLSTRRIPGVVLLIA
ncbi:FecR domain-containing protein [Methylopila sp. 73B]|uniref:FecR family protein n=1 Tax=Methylopila sp. 73B TaxID=1120792 RepID=UPI00037C8B28|nr:FecR domain-containing protein [Methylopila sp. 73B]